MKNQSVSKALIYLDITGITWFQEGLNPLSFQFPADSIKNLEVINKAEIQKAFKLFLEQQKLQPTRVTIIIGSRLIFANDIPKDASEENNTNNIDTFLGLVPFEDVTYTLIQNPKTIRIIAVNQEFYQTITEILTSAGHTVDVIAPLLALGDQYANITAVDAQLAKTLFSNTESFKKNSFIPIKKVIEEPPVEPTPSQPKMSIKGKTINRQYILLGVLGILLVVLGFVVYFNVIAPPPPVQKAQPVAQPVETIQPTPIPTITEVASVSADLLEPLTVQILYTEDIEDSEELEENLSAVGFETITIRSATNINTPTTTIVYSDKVTADMQPYINETVKQTHSELTTQVDPTSRFDVSITITKPTTPEN